jgi:hypothetical protein
MNACLLPAADPINGYAHTYLLTKKFPLIFYVYQCDKRINIKINSSYRLRQLVRQGIDGFFKDILYNPLPK